MDEYGIAQQVLYPNLIGFFVGAFIELGEPELMLACVQGYNDFLAEFADADPNRLIPLMMLPYWDLDASLAEMDRCVATGHRGIVAAGRLGAAGLPALRDTHWDPLWAAAQERGLPINFHIGFNADPEGDGDSGDQTIQRFSRARFAEATAQSFSANMRTLGEVLCSGLLHRFPALKIVSVESGVGWLPFFLEALDWQWQNTGVHEEHPDWELPSVYFGRQVYATFWFERRALAAGLHALQDNAMFSTDFPHPTSQSPGPASFAVTPSTYAADALAGVDRTVVEKVLRTNAQRVYQLA
jgi:predicted TIM-barrel fold metal-dependent hydrolase